MSLLSRVLLKSAYVCANDDAGASIRDIRDYQMKRVVELHTIQRTNCEFFELTHSRSSCLNSRRVAQPRPRLLQMRIDSILDAKLLESNPSFPIIRHELAPGPAHPLINVFLIERLIICFWFERAIKTCKKYACVSRPRHEIYLVFCTERWGSRASKQWK